MGQAGSTKAEQERDRAKAKVIAYIELCCTGATKFNRDARCLRELQDALNVLAWQRQGVEAASA